MMKEKLTVLRIYLLALQLNGEAIDTYSTKYFCNHNKYILVSRYSNINMNNENFEYNFH